MTSDRDRPPIHRALPGTKAVWTKPPRPLEIWLADDLDEVTRERYIAEAMAEHGLEYRRRGSKLFPIPLATGMDAVRNHRATSAAVALSVLTAGGVGLAVVHDDYHAHEHPPGAASAPRRPTPSRPAAPRSPRPLPSPRPHASPSVDGPTAQTAPTATASIPATEPVAVRTPRLPLPTRLPIRVPTSRASLKPSVPPVPTLAPTRPATARPVCVIRVNAVGARVRVCLRT